MSACATPQPSLHTLPKWNHTPGMSCARQRGVPTDEQLRAMCDGGRLWLPPKLVDGPEDDLVLEGLAIQRLADWADGTADTDWMLPMFWGIARGFQKVRVGEVGMRHGISTLALLLAARDVGGHVWSIDIDECLDGRRNVLHAGLADYHTFIHGDSAACEFPEELDVLFIDGEHSYAALTLDFQMHAPRVKEGGVILFHDTTSCPEVGQFVREVGGTCLPMGAGLGVLGC
jgi:hypothetical protein